jgi:hypothetical protein
VTLPPSYQDDDSPPGSSKSKPTSDDTPKPPKDEDSHFEKSTKHKPAADGKTLILYAYAESEAAKENIQYFIHQGLHGAADFIFLLNGETSVADLIPKKDNIKVISRKNDCFDLGAYGETLRKDDLWKQYKRFITLNASIRGPFVPYWSGGCWSDLYLSKITEKVKVR